MIMNDKMIIIDKYGYQMGITYANFKNIPMM